MIFIIFHTWIRTALFTCVSFKTCHKTSSCFLFVSSELITDQLKQSTYISPSLFILLAGRLKTNSDSRWSVVLDSALGCLQQMAQLLTVNLQNNERGWIPGFPPAPMAHQPNMLQLQVLILALLSLASITSSKQQQISCSLSAHAT